MFGKQGNLPKREPVSIKISARKPVPKQPTSGKEQAPASRNNPDGSRKVLDKNQTDVE